MELAMRPQASICECPLIQTDNVASVIPRSPTILLIVAPAITR